MKKLKVATVVATVVLVMLIPTFNRMANTTRAEPGYGGECIAWMIPPLTYALFKTVRGVFDEEE